MLLMQVLLQTILWDCVSPLIFLPAIALGWWVRSVRMLVLGAVVIAATSTAMSLLTPLPPNAERIFWVEPLRGIAPLLIALLARRLRRYTSAREDGGPRGVGARMLLAAIGGVVGAAGGAILFILLGLAVIALGDLHDREGGEDYVLAYIVGPLGFLMGLLIGAIVAWRCSGVLVPKAALE